MTMKRTLAKLVTWKTKLMASIATLDMVKDCCDDHDDADGDDDDSGGIGVGVSRPRANHTHCGRSGCTNVA